jgi:hypothetical protein
LLTAPPEASGAIDPAGCPVEPPVAQKLVAALLGRSTRETGALGAPSRSTRQAQGWASGNSTLTTSWRPHWNDAAELLLKAAQTGKKSDIEAATAKKEHVLRGDNCL